MSRPFEIRSYAARREALMKLMGDRAVGLFVAPPELLRNGDSHYPFRQSSDLLYLTGFAEPESALVLIPGAAKEKVILFVRPRDKEREIWDGRRSGPEGAVRDFGVDAAYLWSELDAKLPELFAKKDDLYYGLGVMPEIDAKVSSALGRMRLYERRLGPAPRRVVDPRASLHELRLKKTAEEVAQLERAGKITGEAHVAAMKAAKPGAYEYELQAAVEYTFKRHGATPGYTSIVGTGRNATILHYIENDAKLAAGDLVLIDAGAELDGYTADVTRTFPCGGSFTPARRKLYESVLAAQEAAIAMTRVGTTIDQIHEKTVELLTDGMVANGLLEGPTSARVADGAYKKYYMHRTSHWLGLDVHDVGAYLGADHTPRPLEAGMVITIEPGIYVAEDDASAPAALRGVGVRIEDDILVTADGPKNLTVGIPKRVDEIEAICKG